MIPPRLRILLQQTFAIGLTVAVLLGFPPAARPQASRGAAGAGPATTDGGSLARVRYQRFDD